LDDLENSAMPLQNNAIAIKKILQSSLSAKGNDKIQILLLAIIISCFDMFFN